MNRTTQLPRIHLFRALFAALFGVLLLGMASSAAAQKNKKNQTPPPASTSSLVQLTDEQQIDYEISEMLGAWQIGDVDRMHKDYADDVVMVNGAWAPPIIGWANYLPLYQQQHTRTKQIRMDRYNTYIKVAGTMAWACYQWEFSGVVDEQPSASRGQTTLIFQKRNDHWVIVHNHTSMTSGEGTPAAEPGKTQNTPVSTTPQPKP